MAVMLQVEVFWVATPWSTVVEYQHSRGPGRRWRQRGPLKRWYPTTPLHDVTTQKTSAWN